MPGWTLVQHAFGDSGFVGSGSSVTATYGSATTAGNLLVAFAGGYNGGVATFTMPAGWVHKGTLQKSVDAVCNDVFIYENNPGGITSVAMTQDANGEAHMVLLEFSGNATSAYDGITQNKDAAETSWSNASPVPTQTGDLVLTLICGGNQSSTSATVTGTAQASGGSLSDMNANAFKYYQFDTIAGSGSVTPTATISLSRSNAWSILVFKAAGGGGGGGATTNNPVPSIHGLPSIPDIK